MPQYTTRPISDRTWLRPEHERVSSQFSVTWTDTLDLLIREVFAIQYKGMPDPVIEVDVRERDIRIDGGLRADAKAATPAVVVAFESKHGPLLYRCDRYRGGGYRSRMQPWQHNVRAIALTLEALRSVDRYGATRRGEQYTGWKALPPGTGVVATGMTVELALDVLERESGYLRGYVTEHTGAALRRAQANAHPDRNGGGRSRWNAVDEAEQVLRRAGRL